MPPAPPRGTLLRRLGLFGLDHLEPIVVAALATEAPILLVGPHGTAKSRLLLRLAEALGLKSRHYNASLLSFDDLVGYPLPDASGELRFVRTPASIWDAEVVFLDEISRCRPDVQNRVFPIVHERRVQGIDLPRLRHRWAAMNPAASPDGAHDDYVGAEPLDAALADRFPYVVLMPEWNSLSGAEQDSVILADDAPVPAGAAAELRVRVEAARRRMPALHEALAAQVAQYVRLLVPLLAQAGAPVSPRRANAILRNVVAVHAAALDLDPATGPGASAWLALQWSLPHRAHGEALRCDKLLLAHREAWRASGLDEMDPRRVLLAERDPLVRAVLALAAEGLSRDEASTHVADGLAAARPGARHALASRLMAMTGAAKLHAAVAAQLAELHASVVAGRTLLEGVRSGDARHATWTAAERLIAGIEDDGERALAGNVLASLFVEGALASPADAERALAAWRETTGRLGRGGT